MLKFFGSERLPDIRHAALDALRANVMIADRDLTIIYMNPSVMALLREAEPELRKELPRFSLATLIGSNIDVFHKDPGHQRRMLAAMDKPHSATIKVGPRMFDLLVSPLVEDGTRTGFVVEWADSRERLMNLDYQAQILALGRSQAMIQFAPDGTILDANDNFLAVMGYGLEEIRGRNHSIFVTPDYAASADYKRFWDTLRGGQFQAAQFRRFGKDGREVWIEGAYNPILGPDGRVAKVVKFATDITKQMQLLNTLNALIGDVEASMARCTQAADQVRAAAGRTEGDVQGLAASAEQLAGSIAGIAESMARSRAATEGAFDQTQAVARNTETLSNAAQAMTGIVGLIRNIASQINLLALNATIEAARAGEAGKGFAVVAGEVKSLAVQAARATEQITGEINGIQSTSLEVAGALNAIRDAVTVVRESVSATASAMEQQGTVIRGISSTTQDVSSTVASVSADIAVVAGAVEEAGKTVARTRDAARVLVK
ncbi:methyl-accepting chemotaxis protein [Paracraurococcus ruber]|uniref:Methyl-accepting chemotaxis sensory transducer with Pas/Pac sensor n=1 Tax=Paracraurococcus ruber TaxID=77675 RepID=A0ABS1D021_9PROT|nr:PAS domain-containing methyl-accepting chemotaxis protein [Paracraurococcus ruber]MBK1660143.1 hypothetical protein [Paracraurococcus ruber]